MKKLISLFLIWAMIFAQFPVFAETGIPDSRHWEFAWYGGGGSFPMIVPDNFVAGKFYLVSDVGNPMVTTDYAENFTWLSYRSDSGIAVEQHSAFLQSKNDPNLMFVVGGSTFRGGIAKSTDGGQYYRKVNSNPATRTSSSKMIKFDPTTDTIMYAAFNNGWVMKSVDTGETWANLYRPNLTTVTSESAELNGSTNTRTGQLNNTTNLDRSTVVFTSTDEVFTSNSSGKLTGSLGGSGTVASDGKYTLVFFNTPTTTTVTYKYAPKAGWIWVNPTGTKIYSGANGSRLRSYDVASGIVTPIVLTPNTPNPQYNFPTHQDDYDEYVDSSNVTHFCVSAGLQVACTTEHDQDAPTWQYTGDVQSANTSSTSNQFKIHKMAVKYTSTGEVRYVVFVVLNTSGSSQSRIRSSLGGTTWATAGLSRNTTVNPTFPGAGNNEGNFLTSDPFSDDRFFFTTNFTNYRSTNGGVTFFEKIKGAGQTVVSDTKVTPNGERIGCSMDIGCQISYDHGVTWQNLFPKGSPDPGIPYIGGHFWQFEILGSQEDWQNGQGRLILLSNYWYDFIPRVHRCTNNGTTCTTTKLTSISGKTINVGLYGDVIWDRGYIRAISKSKDESVLYLGTDGANCDADGSGPLPSDSCVSGGNNHVFGGLFQSVDDGISWQQKWESPNKIYNALDVDPTDPTGQTLLFGTFAYNLYRTTTGGTGRPIDYVNATNYIFDTAYDSKGHPYAAGSANGGVLYKSEVTVYGNADGKWGTWNLMKRFYPTSVTSNIMDAITIDPLNDNRIAIATVNGANGSLTGNRVWITNNANKGSQATWVDITGDLPAQTGCSSMAFDYFKGPQGYLVCGTSNGQFELALDDTPAITPGVTGIGVE